MDNILLTSENYIKTLTNISENVSGKYILPAIKLAQDIDLTEIIGSKLLIKLQNLIKNKEITLPENEKYYILLNTYIQPFLAYDTISNITLQLSFKLNNFGVSKTDDEKLYNLSFNEISQIKNYYRHYANYYKYRMQLYIIDNFNDFPELLTYTSIADIQHNLYSAADCPIFLGGARNKTYYSKCESLQNKYRFP